jgi:hypothetical protein
MCDEATAAGQQKTQEGEGAEAKALRVENIPQVGSAAAEDHA